MKKNKLTKMLSLILALSMCMSILAGCGKEEQKQSESASGSASVSQSKSESKTQESSTENVEELEPVTLKWYLKGKEMEGSADVEKAFNALLAELLPNTTVEFSYVDPYADNWPLLIGAGEKMDIAWVGYATPFLKDVMEGTLLPLTDLIEEYAPNLQEEWEIWKEPYNSAVYEGELYAIPCVQPILNETQWFSLGATHAKYVDNDALAAELRSTTKLTPRFMEILEEGFEAGVADGAFEIGKCNITNGLFIAARGYMPLGDVSYNMWYDPEAEHPVPLYIWEIPEVEILLDLFARYYDEGLYTDAQIIGQTSGLGFTSACINFYETWNANWSLADERGYQFVPQEGKEGYYKVMTNAPSDGYKGTVVFGSHSSYLAIPHTAENPERAIMLLDLLRSEEGAELVNMLSYGFEKDSEEAKTYGWFNYALTEDEDGQPMIDKSARGDAASKHELSNWSVGNTFKVIHDGTSLTTVKSKDYVTNYYKEVYPTLKESALAGMIVDYSKIENEIANLKNIYAEYESQMDYAIGGSEKIDALYEEVMNKLNEAGLDKVKAELQSQIDAFLAK